MKVLVILPLTVLFGEAISFYTPVIHPPGQFFYALNPLNPYNVITSFYSNYVPFIKVSEEEVTIMIKKIKGLEFHDDDEYGVDCMNNKGVPVPCANSQSTSSWRRKGCNTLEKLINFARRKHGISALTCDQKLSNLAWWHSVDQNKFVEQGGSFNQTCDIHSWYFHHEYENWNSYHPCCHDYNNKASWSCSNYKVDEILGFSGQQGFELSHMEAMNSKPKEQQIVAGWINLKLQREQMLFNVAISRIGCTVNKKFANCWLM